MKSSTSFSGLCYQVIPRVQSFATLGSGLDCSVIEVRYAGAKPFRAL